MTGLLVALEGLDGAGTTTQAKLLVGALWDAGRPAHLTREPSDGPIGRLLREMLVGRHGVADTEQRIDASTFSLLFAADRMDHVQREVEPALQRGRVVVSDRWYHSSMAYQAEGPADLDWVVACNQRVRAPDMTLFLRIEAGVAAQRRIAAGRAQELFEDLETQARVQARYWDAIDRVRDRGEPVCVIDGHQSVDAIRSEIWHIVDSLAELRLGSPKK